MFKVGISREESAKQIAETLNNCNMLFSLEVEQRGSNYIIFVKTDQTEIEYRENSSNGMEWFLGKLKLYVENKEDIDDLFEELEALSKGE